MYRVAGVMLFLSLVVDLASAQVVQLPTFQVFSVGTSVLVPDRGTAFLGGVDRAAYGSTTRGVPGMGGVPGLGRLFTNRGIGSEVSSSRAYASATIMDLGELDRAVLAEAAAKRAAAGIPAGAAGTSGRPVDPEVQRKAAFLSKHLAKTHRTALPPAAPRREESNSNYSSGRAP